MSKHLYLLILLTFITGAATGAYVYFISRDSDNSYEESSLDDGYEIIGSAYGGCRTGCASFRILDDGSFTYLAPTDGDTGRYEDTLSREDMRRLGSYLEETELDELEESSFRGTCPVTYDGLAYQFEIQYGFRTYEFDSCVHALDGVPLFDTLMRYFESTSYNVSKSA